MQQRAIPALVVNWLVEFGHTRHDHHGGLIHYFDKHSRRRLEQEVGHRDVDRLAKHLNSYAVSSTSDNTIVTVGHRSKRFNRS